MIDGGCLGARVAGSIAMMELYVAAIPLRAGAQLVDDPNHIIGEGPNHSHLMQTAEHPTDGIGGRLTNSPQMHPAEDWKVHPRPARLWQPRLPYQHRHLRSPEGGRRV